MKKLFFLALALVALAIPFLACGSTASGSDTGTAVTPNATSANSTPTSAPKTFKVGDTVKIGDWTVKVNKVTTSKGGEFSTPKSGNIFLIVNVTATNMKSSAQSISSALNFKLADSTGQSYTETVVDNQKNPPDGTVNANSKVTGEIAYEVPKSEHNFTLAFQPDITSTDQATWNISIS